MSSCFSQPQASVYSAWQLPEILFHIGQFLVKKDVCVCILVSRSFHTSFIPFLWRNIKPGPTLLIDVTTLRAHAHHVRSLTLGSFIEPEYYNIKYENLVDLSLDQTCVSQTSDQHRLHHHQAQIVRLNPTIQNLTLKHYFAPFPDTFWVALGAALRNPKALRMSELKIEPNAVDSFWNACTRFQEIEIDQVGVILSANQSNISFPQIRSLKFEDGFPQAEFFALGHQMDVLSSSPGLMSLDWKLLWSNLDLTELQQRLNCRSPALPALRTLRIYGSSFSDEKIAFLIQHAPTLTSFCDDSKGSGSLTFSRLKTHHFDVLETISMIDCVGITSSMCLELLSSCPQLRVFAATCISIKEIVQSPKPWVCSRLERFEVLIAKQGMTPAEWEQAVFDRISKLTNLREINLCPSYYARQVIGKGRSLDFRLVAGLGQLKSLSRLRFLGLERTIQDLDCDNVFWMMRHWKALRVVRGKLSQTPCRHQELTAMLQAHGVSCLDYGS
ncbi:hypothetical protein BGX28_006313 [Mortierella sp. GBA30]|nr:hypothetical protein BGX28_006313 [Mortierella sp. GBA30]